MIRTLVFATTSIRQLLVFLSFFLIPSMCVSSQNDHFEIKGRVKGLERAVVTLQRMNEWRTVSIGFAVDTIKNGRFFITGNLPSEEATLCYLYIKSDDVPSVMGLAVWVKNGTKIKVRGKTPLYPLWHINSPLSEQQEEQKYIEIVKRPYKEYLEEILQRDYYFKTMESDKITPTQKDSLLILYDEANLRLDSLNDIMDRKKIEYMYDASVSEPWLRTVENLSKFHADKYREPLEFLLEKIDSSQLKTVYGRRIMANLFPPETIEVGDYMADTDLYDLEGNVHRVANYLGRYVLLGIWTQFCAGCVANMPYMHKIEMMNTDNLVLITVSVDDEEGWRDPWFFWRMPVAGLNLWDRDGITGLSLRYGCTQFPYYVLISPEGIVLEKCGIDALEKCLAKYGMNK